MSSICFPDGKTPGGVQSVLPGEAQWQEASVAVHTGSCSIKGRVQRGKKRHILVVHRREELHLKGILYHAGEEGAAGFVVPDPCAADVQRGGGIQRGGDSHCYWHR